MTPKAPTMSYSAAIVTGASQGLGRAIAIALARRGTRIAGVARTEAPLRAAADAVTRASVAVGTAAISIAADIGDPSAAAAIVGQATAALGPIDLVVHAASTLGPVPLRPLSDIPPAEVERVFAVNVLGPLRLSRQVVPSMVVRGMGTVVTVSSDAATCAYPHWGPYGASKAAADLLSQVWAAELANTPVRFFAIDPGEMNTQMHRDAIPNADPETLADPADVARSIVARLVDAEPAPPRLQIATLGVAS